MIVTGVGEVGELMPIRFEVGVKAWRKGNVAQSVDEEGRVSKQRGREVRSLQATHTECGLCWQSAAREREGG
jgi:hypothetical protein